MDRIVRLREYLACCRRAVSLVATQHSLNRIVIAEQVADGLVGEPQRAEAEQLRTEEYDVAAWALQPDPFRAASAANYFSARTVRLGSKGNRQTRKVAWFNEMVVQGILLRDIFGNPFRPVALEPAWLTSTVLALASGIYEERAFDRLPILADALMDAGCDHADILDHCRGDGPHVRGCWVVDLILGKA